MNRRPAAVAHGLMGCREYSPVTDFIDGVVGFAQRRPLQNVRHVVLPFGAVATRRASLDNGVQRGSRPRPLGRETVHFEIMPVADDQSLLTVEHGEALGHVVQGGIELL